MFRDQTGLCVRAEEDIKCYNQKKFHPVLSNKGENIVRPDHLPLTFLCTALAPYKKRYSCRYFYIKKTFDTIDRILLCKRFDWINGNSLTALRKKFESNMNLT